MNLRLLSSESKFCRVKRTIWNRGIFLLWCLLWIRKDEFHYSLYPDVNALIDANPQFTKWYWDNLLARREIAHQRTMNK